MSALLFALALWTPAQTPDPEPADPPGAAAAEGGLATEVFLITIGPGDHLWTSFGHTAISVMRINRETRQYTSTVYNWGDADFGGWAFMWSFFTGEAIFRLSNMGTIEDVVNQYATLERTLVQQRLALNPAQAELVAKRLEFHARPENRDYLYHHFDASCSTKVRDFLDQEVVGGAIKHQLAGQKDPLTPRYYGRRYFAGFFFAELFNDLFMGRLHDKAWNKYEALTVPDNLAAYLQEVQVEDPKGSGQKVPLASAAHPIVRDVPDKPYRGEGRSLIHVAYILLAIIVAMGIYTLRRKKVVLEDAGFWLFLAVGPSSAIAVCMVFGALVSNVSEGRLNELNLIYPLTDVALLPIAYLWWRGKAVLPGWLWAYGCVRLAVILVALLLHAFGVLYQEPRILVVAGFIAVALFLALLGRLRQSQAEPVLAEEPQTSAPADAA